MLQHTDYIIKNEIGRGGMATVYLAYDQVFKCDVAIKILNKEFLYNEHVRNRFLDEARKLYRMNHPNIIRVTRIIEEQENVGFVMEYFDAITLKDLIDEQGKLLPEQIVKLMTQMLDALKYVHQQGMVHRDVKPSNFMVDKQGSLKLLDFGIAKNSDPHSAEYTQTAASYQMGTPMYMSPEQINESRNVTAQSDIFSLGVVLWYMVMGERPYETSSLSTFQLLSKIVNEQLKDTGSVFQSIISKCTAKDLTVRYTDCDTIKVDLLKIDTRTPSASTYTYARPTSPRPVVTTESTQIVNFEKATSSSTPQNLLTHSKYKIAGAGLAILMIAIGIFILTNKKEPSPDPATPPETTTETVTIPTVDSAISSDVIIIDSSEILKNEKPLVDKQTKSQPKKSITTAFPSATKKTAVVNTTTAPNNETKVDPAPPAVPPVTEPITTTPSAEPAKKETKLKKNWNKIKEKVNNVFKKKDKE